MNKQPQLWCGIDIAKNTFDAAIVTNQRIKDLPAIPVRKFEHSGTGIATFLKWLGQHCKTHELVLSQSHLILEATGRYSLAFHDEVCRQDEGFKVSIVNPAHAANFQKSLGKLGKTDALDARVLGIFGRERKPDSHVPASPQQRALQELFRQRIYYVKQRVAQEARLREGVTATAKKLEREAVTHTKRIIEKIEAEIKKLLNQEHELGRDAKLLMTIPGVGLLTAAAVLAELGDLRRFGRAAELSSYTGLAPQVRESGTSLKGRARVSKAGNRQIRRCLYMATLTWTTRPKQGLGVFYARLVAAGKEKKSALLAVTRKLLVLMRAILITGEPYKDHKGTASDREEVAPVSKGSAENVFKKVGRLRLEPKF